MREFIRQRALDLGFDACGFTTAAPPASAPHFRRALAEGRMDGLPWLARNADRRTDPQRVLPGARSIVVLAAAYSAGASPGHPASHPTTPPATAGQVARYARHEDYHDVLATPLRTLASEIDAQGGPGTRSLWYVDTGPLLERDLAQRAGVGFVGKHTNLIGRHLGNWFLLAEILTTVALEPDPPERNHCGSCTRCLAACPTGCLTAPFTLDARRCISYLTIELKGSIPEPLRPLVGNRIFGCDDCLAACPWNRFAREGRLLAGVRRGDLDTPELLAWLDLDEAGFRARFAGTPLLRSKRRGLLRNVCVALGNVGDERALGPLSRAASDPEPLVAEAATWALARLPERLRSATAASAPPRTESETFRRGGQGPAG